MRIRRKLLELPSFYRGTRARTHLSLNNMLASSNWRWFIPWWKGTKHLYRGWRGGTQLLGISCSIVTVLVLQTGTLKVIWGGLLDTKEQEKGAFISVKFFFMRPYLACSVELSWMCAYMYTHTYIYVYVCAYIFVYTCICVYTHTHTYIHTYIVKENIGLDPVLDLLFKTNRSLCNAEQKEIARRERMVSKLEQINDAPHKLSWIVCHGDSVFHQTGPFSQEHCF